MIKDDSFYLNHIIESITKINTYTHDLSFKQFLIDSLIQDATIRQ